MNQLAKRKCHINTSVTGGNLTIIQTTIGTPWQINTDNKILLLEDIGERGYRVDRILEHLRQADIFKNVAAVLLGDFTPGYEPNGMSLIEPVLKRFAEACDFSVVKINGIGHNYINYPMPLGTISELILGEDPQLICSRGIK
ncbi:MAG: hypothetical protein AB7F64_06500 [Gammaproteobacteria bacterium]